MRFLILIVCIILGVAVFSTQNSTPVSVTILAWDFKASIAIIIFLSATGGVIFGILASFLLRFSKRTGQSANRKSTAIHSPGKSMTMET